MASTTRAIGDELADLFASSSHTMADPYRLYRRLVKEEPVVDLGAFAVLSPYHMVRDVITDSERFSNEVQGEWTSRIQAQKQAHPQSHWEMFDYVVGIERRYLTELDGELHNKVRKAAVRIFTPRRIAQLTAQTQELAERLLTEMAARSEVVDFAEYSYRLPALVIADMLGIPAHEADDLVAWADAVMKNMFGGQGTAALEGSFEGHRNYDRFIADKLEQHRSGAVPTELFRALLDVSSDEDQLDNRQVSALYREQVFGGFETTRGALVGTAFELLCRPEQWAKVRKDPSLAENAVEEGLRFVTPVQWTARIPFADVTLQHTTIEAGKTIMVMLAAANRDPAVFPDPDAFLVERRNARQHLSFAVGKHYCLGQALARLEGRITFETLVRRFPDAELAIDPAAVRFGGQSVFRKIESLPIRLGPERPA